MTMQKIDAASPQSQSADVIASNIAQLKALFPELLAEGANGAAINVDVLKALVGDATVVDADEKYGLNWHGKRRARQLALTPSSGTLRPCPDESVDWNTSQNLMIEGDNLEVLKLLQKSYAGKVKLIYIDPPYNTGKDFVYPDNFHDGIKSYLELTGQTDAGLKVSSNTEASGRFHTDWLNMMLPRLKLARNLLREDGLLFVSIDDSEVTNLRQLLDEVFGAEHLVAQLVWKNKYNAGALTKGFSSVHEYVLCYAKGELSNLTSPLGEEEISQYKGRDEKYALRGGFVTQPLATSSKDDRPNLRYPITIEGREIWPEKQWIWSRERIEKAIENNEVVVNDGSGKVSVRVKQYLKDEKGQIREMKPLSLMVGPYNQEGSKEIAKLFGDEAVFSFPKPMNLVKHIISLTVNDVKDKDALVLDFFAGSGTTAHAVMAQNALDGGSRKYILVQLPERLDPSSKEQAVAAKFCEKLGLKPNLSEITKERIRRSASVIKEENPSFEGDMGFRVFKLDESCLRAWSPNPSDLQQSLLNHQEHVLSGRTEEDVLYELLLKLGLDLCVPIQQQVIVGKSVYAVGAGVLLACLAESILVTEVEELAQGIVKWHQELKPVGEVTCVFRDSAFADDVAKTNLAAILQQYGIQNVRSL